MTDLANLSDLSGAPLSEPQMRGLLAQIDLDIANLVRDGKLAAAPSTVGGAAGQSLDRAANLNALLKARDHYQSLLNSLPAWTVSQADC